MKQLEWDEIKDLNHTHSVDDGVITYWTAAPGMKLSEVALAFASMYDHGDNDNFTVCSVQNVKTGKCAFFAIAPEKFEWNTERQGGARGY